jgi:molybdopterin-containing oxidoreductase family iron-sulfur binding subunit
MPPLEDKNAEKVPSRRDFMKLMGASLGLAGLGGCIYWPEDKLLPFSQSPPNRLAGQPVYYATAMELNGVAQALLAKSVDGRPIKIEGNAGGTDALAQALVLGLYDPDRSRVLRHRKANQETSATWQDFATAAQSIGQKDGRNIGAGLHILSEGSSSRSVAFMRQRLLKARPEARWHEYEPVSLDNEREGTKLLFGKPYRTFMDIARADIIVAFDDDFLMSRPQYMREFAARRRENASLLNRLYAIESTLSVTGANADHRLALPPHEVALSALQLAALLFERGLNASQRPALPERFAKLPAQPLLQSAADDLMKHRGRAVIAVGPRQQPIIHALAHWLNLFLGSPCVFYAEEEERPSHIQAIQNLAQALDKKEVGTLVILGGNPVYNAPADLAFAEKLGQAAQSIHLSLYDDETSRACNWHLPRAHTLESWGDAEELLIQPLIEPLYGGKTPQELLALLLNEPPFKGAEIVARAFGEEPASARWRKRLHDNNWTAHSGVKGPEKFFGQAPAANKLLSIDWESELAKSGLETPRASQNISAVFVSDYRVYDGRFANNAWLQEMPDPITKLTWDNAALLAPATAQALSIKHGDLLKLELSGRSLEIAALILPGQPERTLTLPLGYGRKFGGQIADGAGFNSFALRTTQAFHSADKLSVARTGATYKLASTQDHHAISAVLKEEETARVNEIVPENDRARRKQLLLPRETREGQKRTGHRWGMAIDLAACTGCSACVLACQAENNVAVVGKDEVGKGREMHWLRVDRYFKGPRPVFQPVPCMHCETAPCEEVCPVAATNHSEEGLNNMVYNRCVGTRYCSNNCPYKVRRFNWWHNLANPTAIEKMVFNPEVTVRSRGVMEKCTYCLQRIEAARIEAKNNNALLSDGAIVPACAQACPAQAIVFGDLNDPTSRVTRLHASVRAFELLGGNNFRPRTRYLARLRNPGNGL